MSYDLDIEIPSDRQRLALDKRTFDIDGRLTITDCVISASQVNPYLGKEIPDAEALGLDLDRPYMLYRDPAALKAAVPLFDGIPLLIDHAPVSALDPKRQLIVGTVSDCHWSDGKVIGTVNVWDQEAIRGIESNLQRDLSAGYRYTARMTPGVTPDGEKFDGRMVAPLIPNHVALVSQGRVSGAMVGDSGLNARYALDTLQRIAAERDRARQANENSPLGRAVRGYYRLR
ncbi:MAG: DUF2213 domain-containing protein [Steroidobacteraceae bacterium]